MMTSSPTLSRVIAIAAALRFSGVALCVAALALVLIPGAGATGPAQPSAGKSSAKFPVLDDAKIEQRVEVMLSRMTLEEKIDLIGGVDAFYLRSIPRLGLPRVKMSDGPLGARNDGPATTMAGGISLAATWNTSLAGQVGTQIGRDARARGVHFMLGPGVNIYVSPLNGRNFEYFGEDPFLASRITVGYIQGMQSQGVSATIKHFMGNNSEFDRHNIDSIIDERTMREIYLPAFEAAVKQAHVGAIMDSYNLTNGEHLTQNGYLNNDVVKKDWGFRGIVMSDWLATYDGIASANAGMDVEMPFGLHMNRITLAPAVKEGKVSAATIDDKVRRVLRTEIQFGWLDRDQKDLSIPLYNPGGNQAALQASREGMVLLKNDGALLPLNKNRIKSVAVIGPDGYPAVVDAGGSAEVRPFTAVSFMEGLSDALRGKANVYYNRGVADWNQLANQTAFRTAPEKGKPGLTVETFNNTEFSGSPASSRVERRVNRKPKFTAADLANMDMSEIFAALVGSGGGSPNGTSTRWTGYYTAAKAGAFEAFVQAPGESGGHRLYIDDNLVLDNWKIRKAILDHGTVQLTEGSHKVVFEQFQPGRPDFFAGTLRLGIVPQQSVVDPAARALASHSDVVVVAAGFDPESESEGGDRTFSLPLGQDELIREMAAANKNVIVVVTSGGAVDTGAWLDRVPALIEAWYPGQEGGAALADILLGDVDPSGRLPISYDRTWQENPASSSYYPEPGTNRVVYKDGIFVGYRGYQHENRKPLFPFGYGLSYTTFKFSKLAVKPAEAASIGGPDAAMYEVSFDVTNTGKRGGSEVAQVYVGEDHPTVPRPVKELKGFAKVELHPGETRRVTIPLNARSFAYYDVNAKAWRADANEFQISVGNSSEDTPLSEKIRLKAGVTLK